VVEVEASRRVVLRWEAAEGEGETNGGAGYQTTVIMTFELLEDGRTLVSIAEEGWRPTEGGHRASYANCERWTNALCCMKAWLEYGINLREGFYE
jgi:uncharacterized protein YndB with AHSA1/START domain